MGFATRMLRRDGERTDHPIGLGWLLAISLCGGILLFTTVGLLLVWWVKKTRHPGPQTVYGYAPTHNSLMPPSSSRLIKRRLLGAESFSKLSSRLSSRFSFSGVHVQPPLPTHESFRLPERRRTVSRGRKRSRSWVDEDDLHGPKMAKSKRNTKESWFGRDSWFGLVPTLPNVGPIPEKEPVQAAVPLQDPQPRWLQRSHTEPRLTPISNSSSRDNLPMGIAPIGGLIMPAAPQPARMRPSATDSNLKGILRSTDMRLSQRSSRSSVKISRSSAVRGSPAKTPRSHRTGSSGRSSRGGWRASGSPPKRGGLSHTGSRNNSVSSIGSAANSLIAAATQELQLPGGLSSPSKARGVRWEQQGKHVANGSPERAKRMSPQAQSPQRQNPQRYSQQRQSTQMMMRPHTQMQTPQMQVPQLQYPQLPFPYIQQPPMQPPVQQDSLQQSPERRMSFDSDKSSSLSTLYSTNEPEEERPRSRQLDDPFVEKGGPKRWPSWQVRQRPASLDPQRRAKSATMARFSLGEPSGPPPLRPLSAISQLDMGCEGLMSPLMLEPQAAEFGTDAGADISALSQLTYLCEAASEISFISMSVDSDATEVPVNETSRIDWLDSSDSASSSPTTPTGRTRFPDISSTSSPYDEREIMSLLMATAPPRRALPLPPPSMTGADGSIITILSPPPRGGLVRQPSTSSSIYTLESFLAEPGAALSTSPSRRSMIHPIIDGPRVSNTVAELRRMNSVLSTYSVASLASTVAGEGDSPTIPPSLSGHGGGSIKSRSLLFAPGSIGSRHYLNVGNTRSMIVGGSHRYGPRGSLHRRAETYHYGKENHGLGLRLSCIMDETLDLALQEDTQGANIVCEPPMEVIEGIPTSVLNQKLGPVEELIAADYRLHQHRASVESLGLYDNDGFLISSPERDAKRKGLRL